MRRPAGKETDRKLLCRTRRSLKALSGYHNIGMLSSASSALRFLSRSCVLSIVYGNPKKRLLVLPPISIVYTLISIVIVLSILLLVDRVLLPYMAEQGKIVSQGWITDNGRLYEFMGGRNAANEDDPTWRTKTFPVSDVKPGMKRILVMGDSYVWGDGSANMNDIWWRRLQIDLEKRGYHNVQVISAGLCGAATHRELRWAQKLVNVYKPDMIVWGYVTNDPEEGSDMSGKGIVKQIQLPKDQGFDNFWQQATTFFPNFTQQLSGLRSKNMTAKYSGPIYGYDYGTWAQKILEGENWKSYEKTIERLGKFVHDSKIPSTVVTLCNPWEAESSVKPVQKLFESQKVEFHDLLPELGPWYKQLVSSGYAKGPLSLAVNPANGHPGVTLTDFYARKTIDILEKEFPQVLGEKTSPAPAKSGTKLEVNDFVPPSLSVSSPKPNILGFYFPTKETDFLSMPLKRPFVQLNLAKPMAFKQIELAGKDMKTCGLAVRSIDENGTDVVVAIHDLGKAKGKGGGTFKLPAESWAQHIDEILVTADVDGPDRVVLLKAEQE